MEIRDVWVVELNAHTQNVTDGAGYDKVPAHQELYTVSSLV